LDSVLGGTGIVETTQRMTNQWIAEFGDHFIKRAKVAVLEGSDDLYVVNSEQEEYPNPVVYAVWAIA
jgi:hypothetical protein